MPVYTEGTRTARLCHSDALYTGSGRPLSTTWYSYDGEGMLAASMKAYYSQEPEDLEPESRVRTAHRDAYGIVVWEEDGAGGLRKKPRRLRYEKNEAGLVRRVIVTEAPGQEEKSFQEIYHIGRWGLVPHRRGLITRVEWFTPDHICAGENRYHYDKYGGITRIETRQADGSFSLLEKRNLQYDEHGRPTIYNAYVIENRYDPAGYLLEAIVREKGRGAKPCRTVYRHVYTYQECMLYDRPEPITKT